MEQTYGETNSALIVNSEKGFTRDAKNDQVVDTDVSDLQTLRNDKTVNNVSASGSEYKSDSTNVPIPNIPEHSQFVSWDGDTRVIDEPDDIGEKQLSNSSAKNSQYTNTSSKSAGDSFVKDDPAKTSKQLGKGDNSVEPAVTERNTGKDVNVQTQLNASLGSDWHDETTDRGNSKYNFSKEKAESDESNIDSDGTNVLEVMDANSDGTNSGNADDEMSEENELSEEEESSYRVEKRVDGHLDGQLLREISQISMIGYPNEEEEYIRLEALKTAISLQAEAAQLRRLEFQRKQGELIRRRIILSERQKRNRQSNSRLGVPLSGDSKSLFSSENSSGNTVSTTLKFGPEKVRSNAYSKYSNLNIKAEMKLRSKTTHF